jgi:hypothetical protein
LISLIAFVGWFEVGAYQHEYGKAISIKKFDAPQGEYSELTADELKGYPALEKALSGEGCTKYESDENSWYCKVHPDEWRPMLEFFEKKRHESMYLFSIMGVELEVELDKRSAVPAKLKDIFESKGISLSENHRVLRMTENWIVIDEGGHSYEIWNEGGKLNVYKQETRPYEIWNEDGRLNVYRNSDTASALLFKINEKYYEIGFMTP